jgi:hypothetical protein
MDIMQILVVLQKQVAMQLGHKVDLYYMEGYGALAVQHGAPFHPMYIRFAFPDEGIKGWR